MRRKAFRWCVRVAVLLGVLASAGAVFVVWVVGDLGESATERWLGDRLRTLVNERLNATFEFDTLDYQYPDTLEITGLRLTAEGTDLIRCERATLAMAERPKKDRPLRVSNAVLVRPELNLVRDPQGGLVGFSGLIRSAAPDAQADGIDAKTFGEQFALEAIEVVDARLLYQVEAERAPLTLGGVHAQTTLDRTDADAMALGLSMERPGSVAVTGRGVLRTDTGVLEDASLDAVLDLSGEGLGSLPTALQELATRYDVSGELSVRARGGLDLRAVERSKLSVVCELRDAGLTWGGLQYPLSAFTLKATTANGVLTFAQAEGDVLGGWVSVTGAWSLVRPWAGRGAISLDEVRLEARDAAPADDPQARARAPLLTGAVTGRVTWEGPLGDTEAVTGGGNFRIEAGRLSRVPVVSRLMDTLSIVPGVSAARDRAEVVFKIADGRLVIDNSFLTVDAAGIKATGTVGLDGSLDLVARAGPLERIEKKLGTLGNVLSATLSFLPRYRVTGTMGEPSVSVALPNAKPQRQ